MPNLRKKGGADKTPKTRRPQREFVFSPAETLLLRRLGTKISKKLSDLNKSAEWLAFQCEISRSTVMEIIAGRSNPRLLTINTVSHNLGYKGLHELLKDL